MKNTILYTSLTGLLNKFRVEEESYEFCLAFADSLALYCNSTILEKVLLDIVSRVSDTTLIAKEMLDVLYNLVDILEQNKIPDHASKESVLETLKANAHLPKLLDEINYIMKLSPKRKSEEISTSLPEPKISKLVTENKLVLTTKSDQLNEVLATIEKIFGELDNDEFYDLQETTLEDIFSPEQVKKINKASASIISTDEIPSLMQLQELLKENKFKIDAQRIRGIKEAVKDIISATSLKTLNSAGFIEETLLSISQHIKEMPDPIENTNRLYEQFYSFVNNVPAENFLIQLMWFEYIVAFEEPSNRTEQQRQALIKNISSHNATLFDLMKINPKKTSPPAPKNTIYINSNEKQITTFDPFSDPINYLGLASSCTKEVSNLIDSIQERIKGLSLDHESKMELWEMIHTSLKENPDESLVLQLEDSLHNIEDLFMNATKEKHGELKEASNGNSLNGPVSQGSSPS